MDTQLPISSAEILALAASTIEAEAAALQKMKTCLDTTEYYAVIKALYRCTGRVIVSGIGKSAIIAQKIVATLNSTGTPSLYMHAADAIHGDLGMITDKDVVILISKSGESPEIKALVPLIKNFGNTLIAITGNLNSFLAKEANLILNTTVDAEADPNNLAPTTSTTAQLVMGDTLAVCLLKLKGFTSNDFAKYHPGGALGKQLYLRVGEISSKNPQPQVSKDDKIMDALLTISSNRLGATAVTSKNGTIIGIITDGDIRRMVQQQKNWEKIAVAEVMSKNPKTIDANELAVNALSIMRTHSISQLIVTDSGKYVGILHIHSLLNEGIL